MAMKHLRSQLLVLTFRVIARPLTSPAGTFVAAQNLGDLERTLARLSFLFGLIGLVLLLMIAAASRAVIKLVFAH